MNPVRAQLAAFLALAVVAQAAPIAQIVPQIDRIHRWTDSNGDTWDPFWADDGQLYAFNCDGRGFGPKRQRRNLALNVLTGDSVDGLSGRVVNPMDEYGLAGAQGPDRATWKVCGQECIDGIFYAFVARNVYGKESGDPLMRQTSRDCSLIESADHGLTWKRSAAENYAHPLWPGGRFGAPGFIHFGRNGGQAAADGAQSYVYAFSNNGFWDCGDDFVLGRAPRSKLSRLRPSDWHYYAGGGQWTPDLDSARPVLRRPGKCGWTSPVFVAALQRYLLVSWYITPTLTHWFKPGRVSYDFFQAEHPWGPWTFVSSMDDRFLAGSHMYGPNLCARFQEQVGPDVRIYLFNSGCPFPDVPTGLYKLWTIPLLLRAAP